MSRDDLLNHNSENGPVDKQGIGDVPHIEVKVEYKGDTVKQHCAHFIDAISFLCHAEAAIRRNSNLKEPVDNRTSITQKENLTKLLGENK